jgi:polyribonucleotide nucleotidyltransferase
MGSGLFQRGLTQVLTTCSLGSLSKVQISVGSTMRMRRAICTTYNFPGYSSGRGKVRPFTTDAAKWPRRAGGVVHCLPCCG